LLKIRLENVEGLFLIILPVHPSTIEELALVRFWLLKLSQIYFEDINAYHCILNPEFLSVLNPRAGPRKILFHANDVDLCESDVGIPADFAQFICARRISLHISIDPHRSNLFRIITGTGNALEKVIITVGPNQGEFCEFLVKVNFEIHFYNFQIL
jgi:hypothetical protein